MTHLDFFDAQPGAYRVVFSCSGLGHVVRARTFARLLRDRKPERRQGARGKIDGDIGRYVSTADVLLFTTPSTATPPGPASAAFHSVANPHRSYGYASGSLGRAKPRLRDLAAPRYERVENKTG